MSIYLKYKEPKYQINSVYNTGLAKLLDYPLSYMSLPAAWFSLGSGSENFLVGWLFWGLTALSDSISVYTGLPEKGRKRREIIDERKMSKQPPPTPTARPVGPCPTLVQISRTPRHWKFTPRLAGKYRWREFPVVITGNYRPGKYS